ncbi:macro domain-containing protein [Arenibaculum pallidiluteum]|uniref:macro domain-containing protein n=1 Tax=Arenibaculum pallidiluteum TaxID=2812559 RepID=UPI001F25FC36|nr:macro domain-containing protein [Arenibaculum pallidiluteum]
MEMDFRIEDTVLEGRVVAVNQDLARIGCDAVVLSAHPTLLPGGGVSGALHRAAGPELARAAGPLGPLAPGEAAATPGFALPARMVIHAVAPPWSGGGRGEAEGLARCYAAVFRVAAASGARSLAIPAIGAGIYGWPPDAAAAIGVAAAREFVVAGPGRRVVFALLDLTAFRAFSDLLTG